MGREIPVACAALDRRFNQFEGITLIRDNLLFKLQD